MAEASSAPRCRVPNELTVSKVQPIQLREKEACLEAEATWIDLLEPTEEQEGRVEALLHIDIPTREEVRSVEESSQIYRNGDALVMTARLLSRSTTISPRLIDVTFILIRGQAYNSAIRRSDTVSHFRGQS